MPRSTTENAFAAGLGAFLAAGGQAEAAVGGTTGDAVVRLQAERVAASVQLRLEDDRFFVSEQGGSFEEIKLDDSPAADALRRKVREMLPAGGSIAVPVGPDIIARGGASGGWSVSPSGSGSKKSKYPYGGVAPQPGADLPKGG